MSQRPQTYSCIARVDVGAELLDVFLAFVLQFWVQLDAFSLQDPNTVSVTGEMKYAGADLHAQCFCSDTEHQSLMV